MSERARDELRPVSITPNFTDPPAGSVLIQCGGTRVMCTASVEDRVPPFREESGGGWLSAEYDMLPGATPERGRRAASRGKQSGRATEIQRLIGRALRAGFDLDRLGPRTIWVDCDVLQADGGTRTAAITGGYAAARMAVERLVAAGEVAREALTEPVAAVSVGIVDGTPRLDLDYALDSRAGVDMNVVMDGARRLIELQGTAEGSPFTRSELDQLVDLADKGIGELVEQQREAIRRGLEQRPGR